MLDGAIAFGLGVGIAGTFVTVFAQRGFRARALFPLKTRPRCKAVQLSATFRPDGSTRRSIQTSSTQKYAAVTLTELADALSGSRERPCWTELSCPAGSTSNSTTPGSRCLCGPRSSRRCRHARRCTDLGGGDAGAIGSTPGRERNRVEVMIVRWFNVHGPTKTDSPGRAAERIKPTGSCGCTGTKRLRGASPNSIPTGGRSDPCGRATRLTRVRHRPAKR